MAKNFAADTKNTSTKPARKSRSKKGAETVAMNNLDALAVDPGQEDLDALLSAIDAQVGAETVVEEDSPKIATLADDEVLVEPATANASSEDDQLDALIKAVTAGETPPAASPVEQELTTEELEAVVTSAEAAEVMVANATADDADSAAAPSADSAEAPEGKAKRTPTPRKHYSDKVERLKDRVGASLAEYTVLTTADAMVDEAELGVVMERTLEIIRAMNSKEKNRASNFIEFLSGKKAKLNNVLERVLKVLERDGFIQTGADGNVIKDLLERPYSMASARAMGGNTIGMYADLKVILPDGKGKFVPNPDSLLLAKARSLMAAPAAEPAAAA